MHHHFLNSVGRNLHLEMCCRRSRKSKQISILRSSERHHHKRRSQHHHARHAPSAHFPPSPPCISPPGASQVSPSCTSASVKPTSWPPPSMPSTYPSQLTLQPNQRLGPKHRPTSVPSRASTIFAPSTPFHEFASMSSNKPPSARHPRVFYIPRGRCDLFQFCDSSLVGISSTSSSTGHAAWSQRSTKFKMSEPSSQVNLVCFIRASDEVDGGGGYWPERKHYTREGEHRQTRGWRLLPTGSSRVWR